MKPSINLAPFALTSDGKLLLNTAALDGPILPRSLLNRALRGPGKIFVGVELSKDESAKVIVGTESIFRELAAYAAGARQRQQRKEQQKP